MTPLPKTPTIIIRADAEGNILAVSSNIAPMSEMKIVVTPALREFESEAKGNPFISIPDEETARALRG